jgi:hypothetical protein
MLAAAVAGCGTSSEPIVSKSPAEILAASRAAARDASAVHVQSEIFVAAIRPSKANTKPETKLIPVGTIELQLTTDGGRARLLLFGTEVQAVRIGDTLYVKGGPSLYKQLAARTGVHLAAGTWIKTPADGTQLTEYAALTQPSGELTLLLREPTVSLTKGHITTIDGQQVIELREKAKLYTGAIYIATTGAPYPVAIVKHGRESGRTTFSGWNKPVSLSAPTGAAELSKVERG